MDISQLQHKKVSVIGAARSGIAAAALLKAHGATVLVSDAAPAEKISEQIALLKAGQIEFEVGNHSAKVFNCDLIVLSPVFRVLRRLYKKRSSGTSTLSVNWKSEAGSVKRRSLRSPAVTAKRQRPHCSVKY